MDERLDIVVLEFAIMLELSIERALYELCYFAESAFGIGRLELDKIVGCRMARLETAAHPVGPLVGKIGHVDFHAEKVR